MSGPTQPRRYSRLLSNHGYGHALYEPISTEIVSPGSCGYINNEGAWNPIVHLNDTALLGKRGISPCQLERAPRSTRSWGPKISTNVKQSSVNLEGGVSLLPAGIPADVGALFEYEVDHEEGAILLTSTPVVKESLYHEEPFKRWMQNNARTIATIWPDVLEHGLFIVTSTHSTKEAQLNMLNSSSRKIAVGFNAGFTPVGEIAPSTKWYTSATNDGWISVSADQNENGKVVFFGGLYFRWPFGSMSTSRAKLAAPEKWKQHFRSAEDTTNTITIPEAPKASGDSAEDPWSQSFTIECSEVGSDEGRLADRTVRSRPSEGNDDQNDEDDF